ncbi:MAG TPA: hypothetical protein VM286_01695 [Candidatus Thermoplasmatota archaeon]|nr:hypothetical protein [Candidatus Thermoplasmatota archaeon]
MAGWLTLVAAFTLAWAGTFAADLAGGTDGTLYPVTAYPMFSGARPTQTTSYLIEADGNATSRIPLAAALDPGKVLAGSYVAPLGQSLRRSAEQCASRPACAQALSSTALHTMREAVAGRLGLGHEPRLSLVVQTRSFIAPGLSQETVLGLG